MKIWLAGKTALVTGGSGGIGESCVRLLRNSGAAVFFTYHKNKAAAKRIAGETASEMIECDAARAEQCRLAAERACVKSGRIDILVNCAGIYLDAPAGGKDFLKTWKRVREVNLDSCFHFAHFVIPHMRERGGKIINISSTGAVQGTSEAAAYHSSKAGLDGLTRALAVELASANIQVNSVNPGPTATSMWDADDPSEESPDEIAKLIPARRFAKPDEVAYVVVFLASKFADYITGQSIFVDGGLSVNVFKQ
ncbi:MAG: hypothetical protein A2X49_08280 [Lentisphaerae bacterium GWF2_52_8]|nr:MAG: hypothetical protein A2X49_08280 [Lentisphaerae bacterium GWF2_52_8]